MATIKDYLNKDNNQELQKPIGSLQTIIEKSLENKFNSLKENLNSTIYFQKFVLEQKHSELLKIFKDAFNLKREFLKSQYIQHQQKDYCIQFEDENLNSLKKYINYKLFKKTLLKIIISDTNKVDLFNFFVKQQFVNIVIYFRQFETDPERYYLVDSNLYSTYYSFKRRFNIELEDEDKLIEYVKFKNDLENF